MTSKTPDILAIDCVVAIEAASASSEAGDEERLPRFSMVAYTGGPIRTLGFSYGMTIPAQRRPVRFQHSAFEGVGHTERIAVEDGKLVAEGVVSRDTPAAQEIVASGKKGFPWQASIGASVDEIEYVKRDIAVTVNGRKFTGPIYVAHKTTLNEISFVDLGADQQTEARIAAQHHKDVHAMQEHEELDQMTESESDAAAAAAEIDHMTARARAETDRRQRIQEMTADLLAQRPELADELGRLAHAALEAGWKPDKYQLECDSAGTTRVSRSRGGTRNASRPR
jgi:hypothetical protein